jgi:conjugal transfer mating pair stabilization protein TraN
MCSGQETTSLICPTSGSNSSYTLSGLTCTEKLTQNACPGGYTFDSSNNTCTETSTEPACPNGTLSGGTCTETETATPICSNSDYYFDSSTNSCQPYTQGASCPSGYSGPYYDGSGYDCTANPTTNTSTNPATYDCPNGSTVASSTDTCTASPICTTSGYAYNSSQNACYPTASVSITCPSATVPSAGSSTQTESACPTGYNYDSTTNLCQNISDMSACPANWQLINGVCVSNACPYGSPMYQAPGQANMCSQTSAGSPYYCSPEDCYNNAVNTPQTSLETLPPPQTDNGKVTSCAPGQTTGCGCSGSIYIFSGQAMQCTRYLMGNCCSHSKFMFGSRQCSAQDQTVSQDLIYDHQYSPPVPIYGGSGGLNAAPISSCTNSQIINDACGQLGDTIYIGNYCSGHLIGNIGPCMSHSYVVCAFQGLLATIIQAQGRAQLSGGPDAISWGSAQSPNCTGFTPTQFQELNFSNMNLTEYIDVVKNQAIKSLNTAQITSQIQNTATSIGNEVQMIETGTTP